LQALKRHQPAQSCNRRMFAVLLSLVAVVASFPALAQTSCGDAPKDVPLLTQEQLKGDVTGKAQTFMKLGAAQIQGAVDASRTELYEQHKDVDKHQIDMYFMWISCKIISSDKNISTSDKMNMWFNVRSAFEKHGSSKKDFDDIATWSVSFTIGGIISGAAGPYDPKFEHFLMIHGCDFANLSATQRRVLDFKSELSTKPDGPPDIVLNTANMAFQPQEVLKKDVGRLEATLPNPLILEPGVFAEGTLEFAMSPEVSIKWHEMVSHHLTDMYKNGVLYVIDRLSTSTKKTKLAEHHDASTGAVWRAGCPASLPRKNGVC
jgi:hypothetical protein